MKRFNLRQHWLLTLLALLTVLTIGFIWSNSCMSKEASSEHSGFWMKLLEPILNPSGRFEESDFHWAIRKAAHFAEFALLGLWIGGMFAAVTARVGRRFWTLPVLIVLMVAVLDEYIQFFSERGSAVPDVVLDFAGGLTGLALAALVTMLILKMGVGKYDRLFSGGVSK